MGQNLSNSLTHWHENFDQVSAKNDKQIAKIKIEVNLTCAY